MVGVKDQQLGTKYSNVITLLFFLCVKDWFEEILVSFNECCVYFFAIYSFKVMVSYNISKGKRVVNKERGCCLD